MREQQAVGTRDPDSGGDADVPAETPAWERLEQQIAWYDRESTHNQRWFKGLKIVQIVTAAAIPVAAAASAPVALLGGGGALIVVLEGVQQLQQYQENWITYRSTCERLRAERFLYLSRAGPYAAAAADALLAARVEGLVSQENAAWVATPRATPATSGRRRMTPGNRRKYRTAGAEGVHQLPAPGDLRLRRAPLRLDGGRRSATRNVFMDVDLAPGIDFVDRITNAVSACHVLIVVIGPALGDGHRRRRRGADRRRRGLRPARGWHGPAPRRT